ncbi:hypothetical protein BDZ91DRAFT_724773, partial [Kalaharituber pfeilii]
MNSECQWTGCDYVAGNSDSLNFAITRRLRIQQPSAAVFVPHILDPLAFISRAKTHRRHQAGTYDPPCLLSERQHHPRRPGSGGVPRSRLAIRKPLLYPCHTKFSPSRASANHRHQLLTRMRMLAKRGFWLVTRLVFGHIRRYSRALGSAL